MPIRGSSGLVAENEILRNPRFRRGLRYEAKTNALDKIARGLGAKRRARSPLRSFGSSWRISRSCQQAAGGQRSELDQERQKAELSSVSRNSRPRMMREPDGVQIEVMQFAALLFEEKVEQLSWKESEELVDLGDEQVAERPRLKTGETLNYFLDAEGGSSVCRSNDGRAYGVNCNDLMLCTSISS